MYYCKAHEKNEFDEYKGCGWCVNELERKAALLDEFVEAFSTADNERMRRLLTKARELGVGK